MAITLLIDSHNPKYLFVLLPLLICAVVQVRVIHMEKDTQFSMGCHISFILYLWISINKEKILKRHPYQHINFIRNHINTRVIFYVRRIRLYLYKYRIYGTISIYILKGLPFVNQLI